jgi:hypothetical protein
MPVEPDEKFLFRMYKSNKTGCYHAIFKELNGAFRIYTLLRISIVESEIPFVCYVGGEKQGMLIRGDEGKHQWGLHVMPYIYREKEDDTEFYFLVRNGRLVAKEPEE